VVLILDFFFGRLWGTDFTSNKNVNEASLQESPTSPSPPASVGISDMVVLSKGSKGRHRGKCVLRYVVHTCAQKVGHVFLLVLSPHQLILQGSKMLILAGFFNRTQDMSVVLDSCGAAVPVQSIDESMTSSGLDLVPAMPASCASMFRLDVLIPPTDSRRLKTRWAYESTYKLGFLCGLESISVVVGLLLVVVWYWAVSSKLTLCITKIYP